MKVQRFLINKILLYHLCHELKKQFAEINAQKEEDGDRFWSLLECSAPKGLRGEPLRYLLRIYVVKKFSSHAHKAGSWYLLGFLYKVSDGHPLSFLYGSPPSLGLMVNSLFETCLQGIIVVVFIISDWIIVMIITATMIPCKHVSEGIDHS